jgi:hypothetical protein
MEEINLDGSLAFLLNIRDRWEAQHKSKSARLKYYIKVSRFFFRQFMLNMQRYDVDKDLPTSQSMATDIVYLQLVGDLQEFTKNKSQSSLPNILKGRYWNVMRDQNEIMFKLLGGNVQCMEDIGVDHDMSCQQIRFPNMTEAIIIVDGHVNPDVYEQYIVDCSVLAGVLTFSFDDNSDIKNVKTISHGIAYAMVDGRMRLFDSNHMEPYHILDMNDKYKNWNNESVNELKALDGTDDARSEVHGTLWASTNRNAILIGPPFSQVGGTQEYTREYTNSRMAYKPVRRDIGLGNHQARARIAVDEDSEWNEEDELAHLAMMYMFVELAKQTAPTDDQESTNPNDVDITSVQHGGATASIPVYGALMGLTLAMGLLPR